jgi:hypothetical protein
MFTADDVEITPNVPKYLSAPDNIAHNIITADTIDGKIKQFKEFIFKTFSQQLNITYSIVRLKVDLSYSTPLVLGIINWSTKSSSDATPYLIGFNMVSQGHNKRHKEKLPGYDTWEIASHSYWSYPIQTRNFNFDKFPIKEVAYSTQAKEAAIEACAPQFVDSLSKETADQFGKEMEEL